ncbi:MULTISPECIES: STY4199 family HEPN domain-containing protein [Enterobacteriaceae]|uniref:STY4199 family HEPN domain-containing protein n=1 Tax=Enterobacteriaceae TaxID=543 RepID=UPI0015DD146B|nr:MULTISPECIES: STY4199 family HEPN domain-containing protein [unclassified Klebsiella]BBR56918.1 membrane protein [Klebsiella sp. WP4-W18-ESBL-05]BBS89681.1 membrane protein [Klebsiella sp. WP7-S18-CRE-02]BBS94703.1 membrane protein [Klebsiella sp. WP7-S18-CRE-03]BBS99734.1 membrane protein [Klebsiella sp. WP7-S18-ESBL-04]
MSTSSRQVAQHFEHCLSIIRQASIEILTLLKLRVTEGKDPRWFLEQLDQARMNLGGWGAVARQLRINDSQLSEFMLQLRHLQQGIPSYEHGQGATENQLIAALRFVVTLEHIKRQQPLLMYNTGYDDDAEQLQEHALRQIRTIELTLRGLVVQAWPDEAHLHNALKSLFGPQACARWSSRSPSGESLGGMTFGEVALLIVDKKVFSRHYAALFNYATALTFLVEQRVTLHLFLDDIRRMRNSALARHSLSEMECLLLDLYAQQITAPVQRAYEQGRIRVNPTSLMAAGGGEVQQFWARAQDYVHAYGPDTRPIPDSIERELHQPRRHSDVRERMIAVTLWCAVGVTVLGMTLGAIGLLTALPEPEPTQPLAVASAAIVAEPLAAVSPREILARRGILWDSNALRSAIDSNNIEVAELFLRGGMNWQVSWTELAMSAGHETVLNLLLRYRRQMNEPKPCRRFINTLTHELSQGAPLNTVRKSYLQAFCTTPAVVARQRLAVDNAQRRSKATGDAESKKWLRIQKAIYEVIR